MAVKSACIPLPFKVIMPFAGYLARYDHPLVEPGQQNVRRRAGAVAA
jgi:hypothetical protein